jgi:DNA-binding MarR family transcriptional regulator
MMSTPLTRPPLVALPAQVELDTAHTILNSMALLNLPEGRTDLHPWVARAAGALGPERRRLNRLVFAALRDALTPDRAWPSFPAYLEHLSTQNPYALRDRLLGRLAGPASTAPSWPDDTRSAITQLVAARAVSAAALPPPQAELLADAHTFAARVAALHPPADDSALLHEAHALLADPPAMHDLIVAHLDHVWEAALAAGWPEAQRALQRQVHVFEQRLDPEASATETFRMFTGRQAPGAAQLPDADIERIILTPSPHNGRAVTTWYGDATLRLFFGAPPNFGALLRSSPIGAAELRVRLAALADDTRLRILELLAQHYELHAQELIARLDLSQSSVSRHLKQLIGAGYLFERRGEGASKVYSLGAIELDRTTRALELLASGAPLTAQEQPEEERVEYPPELDRFVDGHGRLRFWPSKHRDKVVVLKYLASRFELGRFYTEAEVNETLSTHMPFKDHVSLRRALFEYQLMKREPDGSRYWREESAELPEHLPDF